MTFRDDLIAIIPSLRAFAYSLCGSRDLADDLAQEALVKAWAKQDSYRPGTYFKAWMFTILRNEYYTRYRKARREVRDEGGAIAELLAVHPNQQGHTDLTDLRAALLYLPAILGQMM